MISTTNPGNHHTKYLGLSSDQKPKAKNGSFFYEMDTGVLFAFDEENDDWLPSPGGGGGGGGTTVIANPELVGDEDDLESIQIGNTKYAVPSGGGTEVEANPELIGEEEELTSIKIGENSYRVFGRYDVAYTCFKFALNTNQWEGPAFEDFNRLNASQATVYVFAGEGGYTTDCALFWFDGEDIYQPEVEGDPIVYHGYFELETSNGVIAVRYTRDSESGVTDTTVDWSRYIVNSSEETIDTAWAESISTITGIDIFPIAHIFASNDFDPQQTDIPEELNAHYLCTDSYIEFEIEIDPICGTPENVYVLPSFVTRVTNPIPDEWKLRDYTITPANGNYKIRIRFLKEDEMPEDIEYPGPQVVNIWIACTSNL